MQCYVKSAGKNYDQDYTWIQLFGKECDRTHLLRQMAVELSTKTLSLAVFQQDNNYYLLVGSLKTERTDIVGTPIRNTFAFVCPVEEEKNIRILTAGFFCGIPNLMQLLSSVIREDIHSKLGFCASKDFEDMLANWLQTEGDEILGAIKEVISGNKTKACRSGLFGVFDQIISSLVLLPVYVFGNFFHNSLSTWKENNILLVNSDKKNSSSFAIKLSDVNLDTLHNLILHSEADKNNIEQQLPEKKATEDIQNTEPPSLNGMSEIDSKNNIGQDKGKNMPSSDICQEIKINFRTAPRVSVDYYWNNRCEPQWYREKIGPNLFYTEIPAPEKSFGVAVELANDFYHIFLEDVILNIKDSFTRPIKVQLLLDIPRHHGDINDADTEYWVRNICAAWADYIPVEPAEKYDCGCLLRCILKEKALVIGKDDYTVNEDGIKKILSHLFKKNTDDTVAKSSENVKTTFCLSDDLGNIEEARIWFKEKLKTTCFSSQSDSLKCYFTPLKVENPGNASYCVRGDRESEGTVIPFTEATCEPTTMPKPRENEVETSIENEQPVAKTTGTVKPETDKQTKKNMRFIVIGAVLLIGLIVIIKSCSTSSDQKGEESLSPTKVEQSSAREGNVSKVNKKSLSPKDNNKQK